MLKLTLWMILDRIGFLKSCSIDNFAIIFNLLQTYTNQLKSDFPCSQLIWITQMIFTTYAVIYISALTLYCISLELPTWLRFACVACNVVIDVDRLLLAIVITY